jgi:hypothetical protein
MLKYCRCLLATVVLAASNFKVHAFVVTPSKTHSNRVTTTTTQLKFTPILPSDPASVDAARTQFFLWFFGASGGAGIARSAFPRMYENARTIQSLKDKGPTKGGPTIGISPLCGYPADIARADVEQIVNNKLTAEQMVQKYPIEKNFLAKRGYLVYDAYVKANADCNPLAIRAIFDTFSTNTDVVSPATAQEKIEKYRANPDSLALELLFAKLRGYSAIIALLFLLALADWEAFFVHGRQGFFPEWPGLTDLPGSLFDPEIGLLAIPKYWLGEY